MSPCSIKTCKTLTEQAHSRPSAILSGANSKQLLKIVNFDEENLHILRINLKNLNVILRKDVTFYNIRSHKNPGFHSFCRRYIFRTTFFETTGVGRGPQIGPPPSRVRVKSVLNDGMK